MVAVLLDRLGIVGVGAAAEVERLIAGAEDEQVGDLVAEMLGLKGTGQEQQARGESEATHEISV